MGSAMNAKDSRMRNCVQTYINKYNTVVKPLSKWELFNVIIRCSSFFIITPHNDTTHNTPSEI